ncbi:MAG: Ig-like domain-containing protein [Bacteroidota bacterium]
MLRLGKSVLFTLFMAISMSAWSQGQYDVQVVITSIDCANLELCAEIQIKATSSTTNFNVADQNYRFTFSSNLANPTIDAELTISGFAVSGPFVSLYDPHTLTGSSGNLLSYNVILAGGDGYFLDENTWVSVGRVCFDIIDTNGCFSFDWNEPGIDFPPVIIVGKDMNVLFGATPGNFIDDSQSCSGVQCSDPPMAEDDSFVTNQDTPLNGDMSLNDVEPDGDMLHYTTNPVVPPLNGNVIISADGTFTYTPNLGFIGLDSFMYEVCDPDMPPQCDTATVVIDVSDCNSLPGLTFNADPCNQIVTITANDVGAGATYTWGFGPGTMPATATGLGPHIVEFPVSGIQNVELTVDFNGCNVTGSLSVTVTDAITTAPLIVNESCFIANDGSANLNVTGGLSPYTFIWNDGQTTEIATGLEAGVYTTIIQDANGCFATEMITITEPPEILAAASEIASILCGGTATGQAFAVGAGGISPLSFEWDNGETTQLATMLAAGSHTVTVSDNIGCSIETFVIITENPPITAATSEMQSVSCFGLNDGIASVTGGGGIAPLTYLWSNGSTETTASMLSSGTHTVTITDNIGCSTTADIMITEPALLTASATEDQAVSCNGASDGQATASPVGGIMPYTYEWDNGNTLASPDDLSAGLHELTITDNNGCTTTASVTISEPSILSASASQDMEVNCNGGSDGQATVSVNGGTSPYTFLWDNGETNATATSLNAGITAITITDLNGCAETTSLTISEPPVLSLMGMENSPVSCDGGNDGSASIMVAGGTMPYTYLWENGVTDISATNLTTGTHGFTVTDVNACSATSQVTLTQLPTLSISHSVTQNVLCGGESTGILELTIDGGTSPYTYTWAGTSSGTTVALTPGTFSIDNLPTGSYDINVVDANNCLANIMSILVTEPMALSVNLDNSTPSSCSLCNATAEVSGSGGSAPYAFQWENGNTSDTPSGLCPGFNDITITDNNGCTSTASFVIPSITDLTIDNFTVTSVSCFGGSDGGIILEVSNGTYPYTYQWGNGILDTDSIITNISAGMYQVTVIDQLGCPVVESISITEPSVLTTNIVQDIALDCFGDSNAAATASGMGGTAPYSFQWDSNTGDQTTAQATGLSAMTYSVTITDTNSCMSTAMINIDEPDALTLAAMVIQDVSCNGLSDGLAIATPGGGTMPYTFLWDNGESDATATNLDAAIHSVSVSDMNGCMIATTVDIPEPPSLGLSISLNQDVSCFDGMDGSLTATPSGGTPAFTFLWENGETDATATGLFTGLHQITVTDANGCEITGASNIGGPADAITVSTVVDQAISCFGANDGIATITPMGGTPAYTFEWGNGATEMSASGLGPGLQSITITDANNCTTTTSVDIIEPMALTLNVIADTNVACFGEATGIASATLSGGMPPYTFIWANGSTESTATALNAGSHSVTGTDANGCTTAEFVLISEPASALSVTVGNIQNVNCFGEDSGSATAIPTGGVPPYTFVWDNGSTEAAATSLLSGIHVVTVSDNNGCEATNSVFIMEPLSMVLGFSINQNISCVGGDDGSITASPAGGTPGYTFLWDNGETDATATNLVSGSHSITVTDANGCVITGSQIVSQPANPLEGLIAIDDPVSCTGASDAVATVSGNGGTPGYSYIWDNGSTEASVNTLSSGTHLVTITDANGCEATTSITITDPPQFNISTAVIQDVACFGESTGVATVTPMGGTPDYSFDWDNGATDATITDLTAANYVVTVTDSNGCISIGSVTINEPAAALTAIITVISNVNCFGELNGIAEASPAGGTPGYTFLWSNGETNAIATSLNAGPHSVTLTDANSCETTASITITQPFQELSAQTSLDQSVSCFGGSNGEGSVSANGGTPPYDYLWSSGETTQSATALAAGLNTITVTDQNGCEVTASLDAGNPDPLMTNDVIETPVSCFGENDGSATVVLTGGNAPFTFQWSDGQTGETAIGLSPGNYLLTVTDINGCMLTDISATITEPIEPLSVSLSGNNVTCWNGNDGSILASATGGTPGYSFSWNNGATDSLATDLDAGTYTVTVTDANGCLVIESLSLNQPDPIIAQISSMPAICFGDANGIISIDTVFGGNGPYIYSLDGINFQADSLFSGVPGGNYQVTIQDINGCELVQQTTVSQSPELIVNLGADLTIELGDSLQLFPEVNSSDSLSYFWDPLNFLNCFDCPNPVIRPVDDIMYTLTITDQNGCTASDDIFIDVDKNRNVYIPNAFSPNDDGINDIFVIYAGKGVSNIRTFIIYDRWGEQVFLATNFNPGNTNFGWDGKLKGKSLNPAVFIFYAEVEFDDGVVIPYKGDLTLLR